RGATSKMFFFTSRRRHTRFSRDWSSDVCSSDLKAVMKKAEEEKRQVLDLQQRKAELIAMEQKTVDAENTRRVATGLKPYPNWESYQASLDALIETRAKIKPKERPALPEEEAFVIEAANVLLDYANLQRNP